jgi:hypothetical protein
MQFEIKLITFCCWLTTLNIFHTSRIRRKSGQNNITIMEVCFQLVQLVKKIWGKKSDRMHVPVDRDFLHEDMRMAEHSFLSKYLKSSLCRNYIIDKIDIFITKLIYLQCVTRQARFLANKMSITCICSTVQLHYSIGSHFMIVIFLHSLS